MQEISCVYKRDLIVLQKLRLESLRIWPLGLRTNQTTRIVHLEIEKNLHMEISQLSENQTTWHVFVETTTPSISLEGTRLLSFDKENDVLLFFKYYDPRIKKLHYVGHQYIRISQNTREILPMLCERAGLAPDTELALFEEIRPNLVERFFDLNKPIEKVSK